jgi:phage FluMu gp28-like protein
MRTQHEGDLPNCIRRKEEKKERETQSLLINCLKRAGIQMRPYQLEAFKNHENGIELWLWGRQCGKSFTLAAWALQRLILHPGRLVTVLSNSLENGRELKWKCHELCCALKLYLDEIGRSKEYNHTTTDRGIRVRFGEKMGRIKIIAANPRTARGFSGDLILDEFAFHENSQAIWEAVEPILAANPKYLCRIASTPNGKFNMFFEMISSGQYPVRKVTRTEAWRQGMQIYHPNTRQSIAPKEALALAIDKRAYQQNYECVFGDECLALLTQEMILQAEKDGVGYVCDQQWSQSALDWMRRAQGPMYVGVDIGREHDLTVITVIETMEATRLVRGILRLRQMRLPLQEEHLGMALRLPCFQRAAIDMTGLGLGLYEYVRASFPRASIQGVNFGRRVPVTEGIEAEGRTTSTVSMTEAIALELMRLYEKRQIQHPSDPLLREELQKPERVISPGGRVSIAASRKGMGHADHFWSLALAVEASQAGRQSPLLPKLFLNAGQRFATRNARKL